MGATILLLGVVRLVWYSLSGFSVLSNILQNWRSGLASLYFCFSNRVNCEGPPCFKVCDQIDILKEKYLTVADVYYGRTKT